MLNWTQGVAKTVVEQVRSEWESLVEPLNIDVRCDVTEIGVHRLDGARHLVTWNGDQLENRDAAAWGARTGRRMHSRAFDVVMLTTGFGVETKSENFQDVRSYWTADGVNEEDRYRIRPHRNVLISGTGDGGLIDALRYSFRDFRHEAVLRDFRDKWLAHPGYEELRAEVAAVENEAHRLAEANEPFRQFLTERYHELAGRLLLRKMPPLRDNISVTLTGKHPLPFDLLSSPLNRLLVSLTNAMYLPGPAERVLKTDNDYIVTFAGGRTVHFDEVVIRHGPVSAVAISFPEIFEQCKPLRDSVGNAPDPTRVPLYADFYKQVVSALRTGALAGTEERRPSRGEMDRAVATSHRADELGAEDWGLYRAWVLTQFKYSTPAAHREDLPDELFMMPSLEIEEQPPDRPHRASVERIAGRRSSDGRGEPDREGAVIRADVLAAEGTRAVVKGPFGSGKTTLFRHVMYLQMRDDLAFAIFVSARLLDSARLANGAQFFPQLLFEAALKSGEAGASFAPHNSNAFLRRFLGAVLRGRAAVYVDGLDELTVELTAANRQRAPALIEELRSFLPPGNSLVLAARDVDPPSIQGGLTVYRLLPFSRRQIEEYLARRVPDFRTVVKGEASLATDSSLLENVSHPILLSACAATAIHAGRPGLQADSYSRLLDELSTDRRVVRAARRALSLAALRPILVAAGEPAQPAEITDADLAVALRDEDGDETLLPALTVALAASHLVARFESGNYRFSHKTIEEWFAADCLANRPDGVSAIETFALRCAFGEGELLPMAVALLPEAQKAYDRLENLPDAINFTILRLRARSLRYAPAVASSNMERLARDLASLVAASDQCSSVTLRSVAGGLVHIRDDCAAFIVPPIATLLLDSRPEVRVRAAGTLGAVRSAKGVSPLTIALQDPIREVREAAATALGEIGGPDCIEALVQAYRHDQGPLVLDAAMDALVNIGDAHVVECLVAMVADRAIEVNLRWPAVRALGTIGNPAALDVVMAAADDPAGTIRESAATALGNLGNASATTALRRLLRDGQASVRNAAAEALGRLRPSEAAEDLRNALDDSHPMVSEAAARALERMGDAGLIAALQGILRNPDAPCAAAPQLLAELAADTVLPALLLLTREPSTAVREGAAYGLGKIGTAEAADALVRLCWADSSEDVRYAAVSRLGALKYPEAMPAILARLRDDESTLVRSRAATALADFGDRSVVDPLCEALDDPGVSRFAAIALGRIKDAKAVPALVELYVSLAAQGAPLERTRARTR